MKLCFYFFNLTHFKGWGRNPYLKVLKFPSDINWPLAAVWWGSWFSWMLRISWWSCQPFGWLLGVLGLLRGLASLFWCLDLLGRLLLDFLAAFFEVRKFRNWNPCCCSFFCYAFFKNVKNWQWRLGKKYLLFTHLTFQLNSRLFASKSKYIIHDLIGMKYIPMNILRKEKNHKKIVF
jgi:hypothetical protein